MNIQISKLTSSQVKSIIQTKIDCRDFSFFLIDIKFSDDTSLTFTSSSELPPIYSLTERNNF